jgi:hypothetical protein
VRAAVDSDYRAGFRHAVSFAETLTLAECKVVWALLLAGDEGMPTKDLQYQMTGRKFGSNSLSVIVGRLRPKLAGMGYEILSARGSGRYRLVTLVERDEVA